MYTLNLHNITCQLRLFKNQETQCFQMLLDIEHFFSPPPELVSVIHGLSILGTTDVKVSTSLVIEVVYNSQATYNQTP